MIYMNGLEYMIINLYVGYTSTSCSVLEFEFAPVVGTFIIDCINKSTPGNIWVNCFHKPYSIKNDERNRHCM